MPTAKAQGASKNASPDLKALAADIEMIKGRLPDQAHAMADVGYPFEVIASIICRVFIGSFDSARTRTDASIALSFLELAVLVFAGLATCCFLAAAFGVLAIAVFVVFFAGIV